MSDTPRTFQETFSASMERVLQRIRTSDLVTHTALAGSIALASALGLRGCGTEAPPPEDGVDPEFGDGKSDWAQEQGTRDPAMVTYLKSYWHEYTNYNGRYGYQGVDVFLKLKVKPVSGASLSSKRVGVQYRMPGYPSRTALGTYFGTVEGGYEEWHVKVPLRSSDPHAFVFNAWYQDGTGSGRGRTFFDDNNGEFYPIAYDGAYSVVRQDWGQTKLTVGPGGIKGKVSVVVADLDYDKDVRIRYSTDGWKTQKEIRMGSGRNTLVFIEKAGQGLDRWTADLDLPGAVTELQYAVLYRHGVVGGAQGFEFWDNNGGLNYVVSAP